MITSFVAMAQGIIEIESYSHFFVSIGSLIPLSTFLTKVVCELIPKIEGFRKQLVSWTIGIGLSLAGKYLHLGSFSDLAIWETLLYGFLVGLGSNGFYDIPAVKKILEYFMSNKK